LDGFPFLCQPSVLRGIFDQFFPNVVLQIGKAENGNKKQYALDISQIDKMFKESQKEEQERRKSDYLVLDQGFFIQLGVIGQKTSV
jgi:hypothetical protein